MASFEIEAMVRGYHIYKDVWSAVIDEEFPCKREDGNRFAVSVCNGDIVIGHVPRKISTVCSLYRIAQKFRGSKFSRIAIFENFVEIISRIHCPKHATPT